MRLLEKQMKKEVAKLLVKPSIKKDFLVSIKNEFILKRIVDSMKETIYTTREMTDQEIIDDKSRI